MTDFDRVTHRSDTDSIADIVSDLVTRLDDFSLLFCVEKDKMTHALRTFVAAYTTTITVSKYEDVTVSSLLAFPSIYLLRLVNHFYLSSWLPEPKLYTL